MRVRIGTKIAGGYVALILLLLVLGVYSYKVSMNTVRHLEQIELLDQRLMLEMEIQVEYYGAMASVRGYASTGQDTFKQEFVTHAEKALALEKELMEISAEDNKPIVENIQNLTTEWYHSVSNNLFPAIQWRYNAQNEEDLARAQTLLTTAIANQASMGKNLEKIIEDLVEDNIAIRDQYMSEAKNDSAMVQGSTIIFAVLAVVVGALLAVVLTNMIRKPILKLIEDANKYAEGDFSQQIQVKSSDEIGDLARSFNNMAQKLSAMIADMGYHAQTLAAHSEELAASGEEVNATVEEVASTSSEVAATAAAGFQNAEAAVGEAHKVNQVAQAGNETVKETVAKINAIASSTIEVEKSVESLYDLSNQIGKITNVITGIAEQTNLLALNAAIEAARAG